MRVFRFMGAIVLALVVTVVAGGVRAYAADGQMDGDPAGVIAYVREHMDDKYRDESFDMYMHDSVEYLEVRNTLVDQRLVDEGTSIDAFYEDEGWRDATYMTYAGTTPLYYASRDWLVALADVSRVNGLKADVSDVDVAANNPYANMVDGAVYDDETGLLYVPRDVLENDDLSSKWSEEFKDGLLAQTLMRIDPTNVSCSLPVEVRRVGALGAKTTEFLNVPFAGFDQTFMLNLGTSSAVTVSDVCTFSSGSTISMMIGEGDKTLEDGVFALRITPFAYTGLVVEVDVSQEGVGALLAPKRAYASQDEPTTMGEMGYYPFGYVELNAMLWRLCNPETRMLQAEAQRLGISGADDEADYPKDRVQAYQLQGVAYAYLGAVLDRHAMGLDEGEHASGPTPGYGTSAYNYFHSTTQYTNGHNVKTFLNDKVYGVFGTGEGQTWDEYLHLQLSDYGSWADAPSVVMGNTQVPEEYQASYKSSWIYFRELLATGRVGSTGAIAMPKHDGAETAYSHAFLLPADDTVQSVPGVTAGLRVMNANWWRNIKSASVSGSAGTSNRWVYASCTHISMPIEKNFSTYNELTPTNGGYVDLNGESTNCFVKFLELNTTADEPYVIIGMQSLPFGNLGSEYDLGHQQEAQAILKIRLGGNTRVHKVPKLDERDTDITEGNAAYTLAGAQYTYYTDRDCTQVAKLADGRDAIATTDASGNSTVLMLPARKYWVKETKASVGFKEDPVVHEVTVTGVTGNSYDSNGNPIDYTAVVESEEPPLTDPVQFGKYDFDALAHGSNEAQGDGDLNGAVFQISYYNSYLNESQLNSVTPTRSWKVKTYPKLNNETGRVEALTGLQWAYEDPEHYLVENDPHGFYLVDDGSGNVKPELPLGTVTVREIVAPKGYLMHDVDTGEPKTYYAHIVPDATDSDGVRLEWKNWNDSTETFAVVKNKVFTGGLDVKKVDSTYWGDRSSGLPDKKMETGQGDATLAGAKFRVYNVSDNAIYLNGVRKESVGKVTLTDAQIASGKITWLRDLATSVSINDDTPYVAELTTDENGECHMDVGSLPYGTYVLREVSPPRGYTTGEQWRTGAVFAVREDKQVVKFSQLTSKGHYNGRDEWDESVTYEFGMRG